MKIEILIFINIVIHNYDKVDDVIIWGIVSIYLPKLQYEIEEYLK